MRIFGRRLAAALAGVAMVASLALPLAARAQEATPVPSAAGTVTVLGRGTVQVKPDTATVQIGINVQRESLAGALAEANDTMTKVTEALTKQGIAADDIQTANFSIYAVRNYNNSDPNVLPPVIGYNVTNQVAVTIRNVEWTSGLPSKTIGDAIGAAIKAGANDIYGISFSVADTKAAEQQARQAAVANAGERAAELAAAAGKQVGEVVAMSEGVSFLPIADATLKGGQGAGGASVPIYGGVVEVAIEVTVTYQLV